MRILLDAMGGDNAPDANIKGAVKAINEINSEIVLIGKEEVTLGVYETVDTADAVLKMMDYHLLIRFLG